MGMEVVLKNLSLTAESSRNFRDFWYITSRYILKSLVFYVMRIVWWCSVECKRWRPSRCQEASLEVFRLSRERLTFRAYIEIMKAHTATTWIKVYYVLWVTALQLIWDKVCLLDRLAGGSSYLPRPYIICTV